MYESLSQPNHTQHNVFNIYHVSCSKQVQFLEYILYIEVGPVAQSV